MNKIQHQPSNFPISIINQVYRKKLIDNIHHSISDNPYILTPLSSAISGYAKFGLTGAAIGAIAGISDEIMINANFTKHYYLSYGFNGAALFSAINLPYKINYIAGFVGGILAPQGIFNEDFITVFKSSSSLGFIGGTKGMSIGTLAGISDNYLMKNNFTNYRVLTEAAVSSSIISATLPTIGSASQFIASKNPQTALIASKVSNIPYFKEAFLVLGVSFHITNLNENKVWEPLRFYNNVHNFYKEIDSDKALDIFLERQNLATFSLEIANHALLTYITGTKQNMKQAFNKLDYDDKKNIFGDFIYSSYKLLSQVIYHSIFRACKKLVLDTIRIDLSEI